MIFPRDSPILRLVLFAPTVIGERKVFRIHKSQTVLIFIRCMAIICVELARQIIGTECRLKGVGIRPRLKLFRQKVLSGHRLAICSAEQISLRRSNPTRKQCRLLSRFRLRKKAPWRVLLFSTSGSGGIRTHGPVSQTPVFKTGTFDHSVTSPIFTTCRVNHSLKLIVK